MQQTVKTALDIMFANQRMTFDSLCKLNLELTEQLCPQLHQAFGVHKYSTPSQVSYAAVWAYMINCRPEILIELSKGIPAAPVRRQFPLFFASTRKNYKRYTEKTLDEYDIQLMIMQGAVIRRAMNVPESMCFTAGSDIEAFKYAFVKFLHAIWARRVTKDKTPFEVIAHYFLGIITTPLDAEPVCIPRWKDVLPGSIPQEFLPDRVMSQPGKRKRTDNVLWDAVVEARNAFAFDVVKASESTRRNVCGLDVLGAAVPMEDTAKFVRRYYETVVMDWMADVFIIETEYEIPPAMRANARQARKLAETHAELWQLMTHLPLQ